jgi:hypothetical protein
MSNFWTLILSLVLDRSLPRCPWTASYIMLWSLFLYLIHMEALPMMATGSDCKWQIYSHVAATTHFASGILVSDGRVQRVYRKLILCSGQTYWEYESVIRDLMFCSKKKYAMLKCAMVRRKEFGVTTRKQWQDMPHQNFNRVSRFVKEKNE